MSDQETSSVDTVDGDAVTKIDNQLAKLSTVQKRKATSEDDVPNKRLESRVSLIPTSPETPTSSLKDEDPCLHFDELNRPNGKWRDLGIRINFQPILDPKAVEAVQHIAYKDFYDCYERGVETERERVRRRREQLKKDGEGKRPTARPTDKAWQLLRDMGSLVNQECTFGHVPGVAIGDQFDYKVQMKAVGIHKHVLGGIDFTGKDIIKEGSPPIALSIVVSGGYQDDNDNADEMLYTGQGGNNLLGHKRQCADQKLERGTLALCSNAEYGIPVRVTKKNGDQFIYDGLWDVLQMIKKKGVEGYIVYQFRLTRCPGQDPSKARQVRFREGTHLKKSSSTISVTEEICSDFSRGLNDRPISVANDVDDNLPPGMYLSDLTPDAKSKKDWKEAEESFVFGTEMHYDASVVRPTTPQFPQEFQISPHTYLITLNHGSYQSNEKRERRVLSLQEFAISERYLAMLPSQIFKTRNRGWGIRTLNRIPSGSFVMKYIGEVSKAEDVEDDDDDYSYDMTERPDFDQDNRWLAIPRVVEPKHVVTGRRYGNFFRFINHSCNPSCFVQPVLGRHLDRTQPDICIFAMRDIMPGEELSYDYGRAYIEQRMKICRCGAACCLSRNIVETVED